MKQIFSIFIFAIFLSIGLSAQTKNPNQYLIDEFGEDNWEGRASRMDSFTSLIRAQPESKGIIEIYGGTEQSLSYPFVSGALLKAYLVTHRGIDSSIFQIINCKNEERVIRHRVYVVPSGAEMVTCQSGFIVPLETTLIGSRFENIHPNTMNTTSAV